MAGRLDGKVCVVTGAGGGIGSATVAAFQREGATVVGVDLVDGAPGDLSLGVDVTDDDAVRDMYAQVKARCGAIHVLFNNAGISPNDDDSILKTGLEAWQRVQDVNLKSVYLCCRHGIPHLLENEGPHRGSVINTASFVATLGAATSQISYTASKGGVLSMSREMGVEFARQGVRVNALSPGPVRTLAGAGISDARFMYSFQRAHSPLRKSVSIEDIGGSALYFLSDLSGGVTGEIHHIDAGYSIISMPRPEDMKATMSGEDDSV